MKAVTVTNNLEWIRSIKPGSVSKGVFRRYQSLTSISVQLCSYNGGRGRERGVFVHAKYDKKEMSVVLVGVTLEERERELTDPDYKDEWRKLIKE